MKQTFDSNTPPIWFLDFQKQVFDRLDKIEYDIKEIKVRLDRLETDVKGIHHRIDNLVKLNKLKE